MKKVLIISYTFPPKEGVGGRRWAKFGKYLNQRGYEIKVVTTKSDFKKSQKSVWTNDIDAYKDKIEYVKSGYPKYLNIRPNTFIGKVLYKLSLIYVKVVLKGNYYDKSAFWKKRIQKITVDHIKAGFNNIIVSVAPFRTAYFIIQLKQKFPDVNFIVDFRDPWINNKTTYGFYDMSKKRQTEEILMEKNVILNYDKVVSVAENMTNYFTNNYIVDNQKILTIPNGFDPDDFENVGLVLKTNSEVNFVFGGTFYDKALYILDELNIALMNLRIHNSNVYEKIRFHFFGSFSKNVKNIGIEHPNSFIFKPSVDLKMYQDEVLRCDACLLFLTDDLTYSLSTKFCDYLAFKKPIVVFSKPGITGKLVSENGIGFSIEPDSNRIEQKLVDLVQLKESGILSFNEKFNSDPYNIKCLVEKIELLLV